MRLYLWWLGMVILLKINLRLRRIGETHLFVPRPAIAVFLEKFISVHAPTYIYYSRPQPHMYQRTSDYNLWSTEMSLKSWIRQDKHGNSAAHPKTESQESSQDQISEKARSCRGMVSGSRELNFKTLAYLLKCVIVPEYNGMAFSRELRSTN